MSKPTLDEVMRNVFESTGKVIKAHPELGMTEEQFREWVKRNYPEYFDWKPEEMS